MAKNTKLEIASNVVEEDRNDPDTPEIGKWYWIKDDDPSEGEPSRFLGCVTHVGSNYVKLEGPSERWSDSGFSTRIHFDKFWDECEYEPDAAIIIKKRVEKRRREFNRLLRKVKDITARLGVSVSPMLTTGEHTQALATRTGEPIPVYREALVKAKDEELPDLYEKMKHESEMMATWMKAETFTLKGQRDALDGSLGKIDKRIIAVDLYAGLSEEVKCVKKGKPADVSEKVHLIQRRCYMDEECLARYEVGGMSFKNIQAFDRWIAKKKNMDRILPFPRCIVAFRIRRHTKEREGVSLRDFFRIIEKEKLDKLTFLYIRNGSQLWRLNTIIDFGEKLFPDFDRQLIASGQKLWAKDVSYEPKLISDNEYQGMVEEEKRKRSEWKKQTKKYKEEHHCDDPNIWSRRSRDYQPFVDENVYYDDIAKVISDTIEDHNRLATIIQGLLDRSPVLKPHPPWRIWTNEGFEQALELVYDEDRALVPGEKPDFEAYRAKLNATLKKGSVTVGQKYAWLVAMAKRENLRLDNDWRTKTYHRHKTFKPWNDPGPGVLARVEHFKPRVEKCTYAWYRERLRVPDYWSENKGPIRVTFTCSNSVVINVDAYKPGDFRQFFDDPRTRLEYLKWAPYLLMAEEYHAGNRVVGTEIRQKKE